jgi:hypothetical protein
MKSLDKTEKKALKEMYQENLEKYHNFVNTDTQEAVKSSNLENKIASIPKKSFLQLYTEKVKEGDIVKFFNTYNMYRYIDKCFPELHYYRDDTSFMHLDLKNKKEQFYLCVENNEATYVVKEISQEEAAKIKQTIMPNIKFVPPSSYIISSKIIKNTIECHKLELITDRTMQGINYKKHLLRILPKYIENEEIDASIFWTDDLPKYYQIDWNEHFYESTPTIIGIEYFLQKKSATANNTYRRHDFDYANRKKDEYIYLANFKPYIVHNEENNSLFVCPIPADNKELCKELLGYISSNQYNIITKLTYEKTGQPNFSQYFDEYSSDSGESDTNCITLDKKINNLKERGIDEN